MGLKTRKQNPLNGEPAEVAAVTVDGTGAGDAGVAGHFGQTARRGDDWLSQTIETQIIPRLMLLHGEAGTFRPGPAGDGDARPTDQEIAELARLAVEHDADVAFTLIAAVRDRGVPLDRLLLDMVAPAARLLGNQWEGDIRGFTEVTLGLCGLQQVLQRLSLESTAANRVSCRGCRALLSTLPGEQHSLGIAMVEAFFREAGWDTVGERPNTVEELGMLVTLEWYDLVGLSVSGDIQAADLRRCVHVVRAASQNPRVRVMIGGRHIAQNPSVVLTAGADATAMDGAGAVDVATGILDSHILAAGAGRLTIEKQFYHG